MKSIPCVVTSMEAKESWNSRPRALLAPKGQAVLSCQRGKSRANGWSDQGCQVREGRIF